MPAVDEDSQRVVWCPRAPRDCNLEVRNQRLQMNLSPGTAHKTTYQSKVPLWSAEAGSLVLKFQQRRVRQASSKNILVTAKQNVDIMVLQLGKERKGKFNLDFKHPMSYLQGFGIALSMFLWKE